MRSCRGLLLGLGIVLGCHAQSPASFELPANMILPSPLPSAPISEFKDDARRKAVTTRVGDVALHGYRYEGKDSEAPVVLFFNGNGMTIWRADSLYRQIAALGPTVVAYDYRGVGFSGGTADVASFREDGLKLYDALAVANSEKRLLVYGYSLGTAVASYVASMRPLAGLILAAPIASAEEEIPIFLKAAGQSDAFATAHKPAPDSIAIFGEAALVAKSNAPLLILHGNNDFLIPIAQAQEVLTASPSRTKRLVTIPDADHNHTPGDPEALTAVKQFIQGLPLH